MTSRRPGITFVHPRLHTPSPSTASTFLRWTKLHFRDLLSQTPDASLGRQTKALRFAAPDDDAKYSHDVEKGAPPYFYQCVLDDVGLVLTEQYYGISRALNLEGTRELGGGEEPVGDEREGAMVWDVVDARFAVFEEVESCAFDGPKDIGSYQNFPLHLTSSAGIPPSAPLSLLIAISLTFPTTTADPTIPRKLQSSLLNHFSASPPNLTAYSSLYHWAGAESQPEHHPLIDAEVSGEWMIMLLVVDEEGKTLQRRHVNEQVGRWIGGLDKEGYGGVDAHFGVWGGELLMS
ncbi:hypothetical protein IQ07DRAFT_676141 [Pyrenochaeta sp. DS3sAY3a]|nr:hypothetical protein IQ07DRAFT_676141 [Pyrenochaeta sp. DS3sAY3a]